jgi:natural resistance-associated macrophage protein
MMTHRQSHVRCAGAKIGPAFLWTAPVTLPMMFAVVYLSAKLGQVTGKGLFAVIREHYSRQVLWVTLVGVLIGNTFEAGADLGLADHLQGHRCTNRALRSGFSVAARRSNRDEPLRVPLYLAVE